ncbi:MAG: aminodeoxychorismate lyase [Sulfuriferula sp.]
MILVNGVKQALVQATDRGLNYGDGVFRTMVMHNGRVHSWQRHYKKLAADCTRLGIICPAMNMLEEDIAQIAVNETRCVVKIIVTRGISGRGYAPHNLSAPSRMVMSSALPVHAPEYLTAGVVARLCSLRLARQPLLAGVKHLNRLEQVIARSEWDNPDVAEGFLLDESGHVISGTMSNLFIISDLQLYTPDLTGSGVAGVTRDRIIYSAGSLGLKVQVTQLDLAAVLAADEVILCNSVIGVWQVRELGEKHWQNGRFTPLLRALLEVDE